MIEVQGVSKSYGSIRAVQNVSFSIGRGEIVGLLGPNGAGKTTLMKMLTGYHVPDLGSVRVMDLDTMDNAFSIKQKVGYLPENVPVYPELNVMEYLEFIAEMRGLRGPAGKSSIIHTIMETGLQDVVYRPIARLSKGFQQRLGIAQAILHDPEILILDEPTSGLDPKQIVEIRSLIKTIGRQKTVILSTHILQEAEAVCARIMIMNKGSIVSQGSKDAIKSAAEGAKVFTMLIKGRNPEGLRKMIAAEGFCERVITVEQQSRHISLELAAGADTDGGVLFEWAVRNDLVLEELQRKRISLEDVFLELTGKEPPSDE